MTMVVICCYLKSENDKVCKFHLNYFFYFEIGAALQYSLFPSILAISSNTRYFLKYSLNFKAYELNQHLIRGNTLNHASFNVKQSATNKRMRPCSIESWCQAKIRQIAP